MSSSLKRIIYVSSAVGAISAHALDAILSATRERNAAADISGLLLYHDGCFFQVLEGPDAAITETYARIAQDARHTGIILMTSTPITERAFGAWSMAYLPAADLSLAQKDGLTTLRARTGADFTGCAKTQVSINSFLGMFRELEAV